LKSSESVSQVSPITADCFHWQWANSLLAYMTNQNQHWLLDCAVFYVPANTV